MKTSCRLLCAALLLATLATADPLTITFSGTGSGMVGAQSFSSAAFTFTFDSDTTLIGVPGCCGDAFSTPAGTPATFSIDGIGSGTFMGDQAVFANPSPVELAAGIWHYDTPDWLVLSSTAFTDYDLSTDIGPAPAALAFAFCSSFPTSLGSISLSSVSDVTYTAVVGAVPEPLSVILLGSALLILCLKLRRSRARRQKA
jgi:hypothetical protein